MSAVNLMLKPRRDHIIIQNWYYFAKFLAFTPISYENAANTLLKHFLKTYPLWLMIIYLGANIFSFYQRFYIYKQFNISQAILDASQGLMEFIFIEHVVLCSVLRKNNWKRLLKNILKLEQKINWTFYDAVKDLGSISVFFRVVVYHIFYFFVHIYDIIANWHFLSYCLAFVIFRIITYYIMFSTLLFYFICVWIKNRYLYLNKFLKFTATVKKNLRFSILQRDNVSDKLEEFSMIYKNLYLIVKDLNVVFGTNFFLISICTVLEILNAVNYGMPLGKTMVVTEDIVGVNVGFLILYVICYSQIIMSCDSVIKSAKCIWKTSLMLHQQVENRELKEEFLNLANYIQGLSPEFSAAGFWTVDQTILSTLFSSVMTYLIIIIQFNITLQ